MSSFQSFGARFLAAASAQEQLALEAEAQQRATFAEFDAVLDRLVLSALHGERLIESSGDHKHASIRVASSDESDRTLLAEQLSPARQQERGAWFIPELAALNVGYVNLAYWWRVNARYLLNLAGDEYLTADLSSPDAVALWAVLEPLFDELSLPMRLRVARPATRQKLDTSQLYAERVRPIYEAFGVSADAVEAFAPGTGWAELDTAGVIARRDALLISWASADAGAARRLRLHRMGQLVVRYYSKAKAGRASRSRVMNDKSAQRILVAYFGGDWLSFLAYLGEEPHRDEEVTRVLPKPRLLVTSSKRAEDVAAAHGLPAAEVERMLAAFWRQSDATSPIDARVSALGRFWPEFDAIHAHQASGMKSLFGLMGSSYVSSPVPAGPAHGNDHFSPALLSDMQSLWSTTLLARFPERLVTEPYWEAAASRAFGPAFVFWQAVWLNAWGICEGGRAHSELDEFETYLQKRTDALSATGCPADRGLFDELVAADSKLGAPRQVWNTQSEVSHHGISLSTQVTGGTVREGFEVLRDIITRHRRAWSQEHLDAYLESRWKDDLQSAAEAYHRHAADKAKPPNVKQFAKMASDAAANWFAGDLSAVYGAIGLKSPLPPPEYGRLLPSDLKAFTSRVRAALDEMVCGSGAVTMNDAERSNGLAGLTYKSLAWVALAEALGHPPELKHYGSTAFRRIATTLPGSDIEQQWKAYASIIQLSLTGTAPDETETPSGREAQVEAHRERDGDNAPREAAAFAGENHGQPHRGFVSRLLGR